MNITKTLFSEQSAKEYAEKTAETVVIREYIDGNSNDTRRISTEAEKDIVQRAIYAALLSIRGGYEAQSAKATAEFFVLCNSGVTHINTYDSVYIPIDDFLVANQ